MDVEPRILRDLVQFVFPKELRLKLVDVYAGVQRERDRLQALVDQLESESWARRLSETEEKCFYRLAELNASLYEHERRILATVACGRDFFDDGEDRYIRYLRAQRASMEAYLMAALKVDMVDADLLARLRNKNAMQSIQARAECMSAFVLQTVFGLTLTAKARTKQGKVPDFTIRSGEVDIFTEVKAPLLIAPMNIVHEIDDHKYLDQIFRKATKQIPPGGPGIVVLCPKRTGFPVERRALTQAMYGKSMRTVSLDPVTGQAIRAGVVHELSGALMHKHVGEAGCIVRHHTRISGVLFIQEHFDNDALLPRMFHEIYGLENPFAARPFPRELFDGIPMCLFDGTRLAWSDGYSFL